MIEKVVIPAAGLGTRLLSATKEQPKEMLPVFVQDQHGNLCLRPLLQLIFEQLFGFGARKFCFIVGRGKRGIEDHFTPDRGFVQRLDSEGKNSQAIELEAFYRKLEASTLMWVNQPEPRGFGHAVLQSEPVIGAEPFIVHAGDTYVVSRTDSVLRRLLEEHARRSAEATLVLQELVDPRQYGVAEVGEKEGSLRVKSVMEKPARPASNLAIVPLYVFGPSIFEALRSTLPGKSGEIQLTDGIQRLIEAGRRIQAIRLRDDEVHLDVGTPETYWDALKASHRFASCK